MSPTKRTTVFWSGVSLAALSVVPAMAQDAGTEYQQDVIVVTASGREALVQEIPIAVTAIDAETIEQAGITDVRGIEQIAPSFRFYTGLSNASGTTAYIRGVGTGSDNPGFESAVGFFVDGVYRNRSGVALSDLPEVTRIEVLRGPQGTLFGRNTSAGAVSIVTAKPEFDQRITALAEVGDYGHMRVQGGITGPIIEDTLAFRLDVGGQLRDGYIEDVRSGKDLNDRARWSARGQLLWEGDNGSVRVIADTASTDENCCHAVTLVNSPLFSQLIGLNGAPATSVAGQTGAIGLMTPNPEAYKAAVTPGRDISEVVDEWGISSQVDWEIGGLDFTSITSYRDWSATKGTDVDFNDTDRAYRDGQEIAYQTLTQEFRLHGEVGRLDWLVGAFYLDEKALNQEAIRIGKDGALFNDALALGAAGAQLFGTVGAMSLPTGFGVTAPTPTGFVPNLVGASFLQSATTTTSGAAAFNALAQLGQAGAMGNAAAQAQYLALLGAYNGISGSFAAARPTSGQGQQADRFEVDTKGIALFTHNIVTLTDKLSLTLGARYNSEEKTLAANLNSNYLACGVLQSTSPLAPGVPSINTIVNGILAASPSAGGLFTVACNPVLNTVANGAYADSLEDEAWTGTASVSYKASEDLLLYTGYSRGFKSGGFNLDRSGFDILPTSTTRPSTDDLSFGSEYNDAYEVGAKFTFPNGGTLNGAYFYQKITDYQNNAFSGFNFITFNVPEVISKGVEIDLNTPLTQNLNLQAGLLYNDAYFNSTVVLDPTRADSEVLEEGTRIAQAPEWSITGALSYRRPVSDTLEVTAYLDGRWNSEYQTQTLNRDPRTDNDAFAIFNARVGVGQQDGNWSTELFVRNLTDEFYYLGAFGPPEQSGSYAIYPSQPRMYGLTVRTNF